MSLIDRQAAIDKINERQRKLIYCFGFENDVVKTMNIAKSIITALPSAQPEIIRCIDCKYCQHWYADKGRCFLWHETGIDVFEDGFCSYAERKENR